MNIRPMRGQVVVREVEQTHTGALWTPTPRARDVKTHTGVVLAVGPPARVTEHPGSPEVPHGFGVGDVVQYHFGAVGTQEARTRTWSDGKPATWLCQPEIDGVWEEDGDGAEQARERAIAAAVPGELVAAAAASAEAGQDYGSFCWAWRDEIKTAGGERAGLLLRDVHRATRRGLRS